jgi:hypothetical protein
MMAASLVTNHAVDWARGTPRKLLRTLLLDEKQTKMVKPANPPKSPRCPACNQALIAPSAGIDTQVCADGA